MLAKTTRLCVSGYITNKILHRFITSAINTNGKFNTDISAYSNITHGVTPLNSYGIIKITGKDSQTFLQGLVTNDITNQDESNTYNAILSPNGRYLYDCFVSKNESNDYLIETDINIVDDLIKYFKKYKLRSKVKFRNCSDEYRVWSILTAPKSIQSTFDYICNHNKIKNDDNICYIDPRYYSLGIRIILNKNDIPYFIPDQYVPIGEDFYNSLKCIYGIPTHGNQLLSDKTIILESNFNYLNGVSFTKGCYVGQELIARTHHRGQIRKRLFGATIIDNNTDNNMLVINNKNDDRDTIIPKNININDNIKDDYSDKSIINNDNNNVVGKIISNGISDSAINCCIVQLRNTAFVDINNSQNYKTVDLKIKDSDYKIKPHFVDYLDPLSQLFVAKE